MPMKFIDYFAGIGGFRRGLELAGHECVGFCEFDKYAVASYTSMHLITDEQRQYLSTLDLKKRQKEILKEEYRNGEWYANDVRRIDARTIPKADIWCFGFPCQDISVAGKHQVDDAIVIPVKEATSKGYAECRVLNEGVRHRKPGTTQQQDEKGESG